VEEIQPNDSVLTYGYDAAGNRTQLGVSAGGSTTSTSYSFNALNRLEVVADSQGQTLYTYDAVGNRASVSYPSGNVTLYDYDALNRLTRLTTTDAADQIVADYAYTLGDTGRRMQVVESHNGRTTAYTYDELYRLTTETVTDPVNGNYNAEYQFDKVGNRTYSIIDGVQTAYSYDNNDRLTQQGGTSYSYDANGNTLTETEDGQVTRYHYDARNKLIEVEKPGLTATYGYNADGIRTRKTENGQTTNYVVDSNRDYAQVMAEVTNGSTEVNYTYGDDLVSQTRAGNPSYYLYDGHGSTRALADASGFLTDSYDYDAFGVLLNSTGDTENAYRYTGEQLDRSLDQYYLRARYYDQSSGRFTQLDTFQGWEEDPTTLHKYLYANADPVTYTDPTGNFGLANIGASLNVRGVLSTAATTGGRSAIQRVLLGRAERGSLGIVGNQITLFAREALYDVLTDAALAEVSKTVKGTKAHTRFEKKINTFAKGFNKRWAKYKVSIKAEVFVDGGGIQTSRRAKGSLGIDVVVFHNFKPLFALDLKTGKAWSKSQLKKRSARFGNIPIFQ